VTHGLLNSDILMTLSDLDGGSVYIFYAFVQQLTKFRQTQSIERSLCYS